MAGSTPRGMRSEPGAVATGWARVLIHDPVAIAPGIDFMPSEFNAEMAVDLNSNVGLIEAPCAGLVKTNQTIRATSRTRRRRPVERRGLLPGPASTPNERRAARRKEKARRR